jgi:hypothetical protein
MPFSIVYTEQFWIYWGALFGIMGGIIGNMLVTAFFKSVEMPSNPLIEIEQRLLYGKIYRILWGGSNFIRDFISIRTDC